MRKREKHKNWINVQVLNCPGYLMSINRTEIKINLNNYIEIVIYLGFLRSYRAYDFTKISGKNQLKY